jgi:hypothetical protein
MKEEKVLSTNSHRKGKKREKNLTNFNGSLSKEGWTHAMDPQNQSIGGRREGGREGGEEGRGVRRYIVYIYHMAFFGSKGSIWFMNAMQTIIVTYSPHA